MGWFFGYGSLVNHHTHVYAPTVPITLVGWRREWVLTELRPVVFLSVKPCPDTRLDGLLAPVPGGDWRALDERERGYVRQTANAPDRPEAQVYSVDPTVRISDADGHILLSYLDVVAEGYLHHFGLDGVARFFESTDGWCEICDDRAAPIYPRHRDVGTDIRALVDSHLAKLVST